MRSVWAVILVLGCGASETTVQAPVAEVGFQRRSQCLV